MNYRERFVAIRERFGHKQELIRYRNIVLLDFQEFILNCDVKSTADKFNGYDASTRQFIYKNLDESTLREDINFQQNENGEMTLVNVQSLLVEA